MGDHLLANKCYLSAYAWDPFVLRLTKGGKVAAVAKGFCEAQPAYLLLGNSQIKG
jgi:hypothetical protein